MLNTTQPIFYINTFTSFSPSLPIIAKNTQNTTNPLPSNSSSMGRQSSDPTTVSSSIALLQERFRQLQKVKERREEQKLLQMLSETERVTPSTRHFEPARLPYQSDVVLPIRSSTPAADSSLSLGLNVQPKQVDYCGMKTLPFTASSPTTSSSRKYDNSELDTSLHL